MRYQNNDHLIYKLIGCMRHSHIFDHMTCHMISALRVLGSPLVTFATQEIKHTISQIPCFNIYDNKGFVNKLSSVNNSFYIILGYLFQQVLKARLLDSRAAMSNSYPYACLPNREAVGTIFIMVFGMILPGGANLRPTA